MTFKHWLIVAALIVAGIVMIPAIPYILMAVGVFAIARMLVRIGAKFSNSGQTHNKSPGA